MVISLCGNRENARRRVKHTCRLETTFISFFTTRVVKWWDSSIVQSENNGMPTVTGKRIRMARQKQNFSSVFTARCYAEGGIATASCPSVTSVSPSVRDVEAPWWHRLQESRAAARKPRDAASVLFGWSSPTTFLTSIRLAICFESHASEL